MKRTGLTILIIISWTLINAQEDKYDSLKSYFNDLNFVEFIEVEGSLRIPNKLAETFFKIEFNPEENRCYPVKIYEHSNYDMFRVNIPCAAGGMCEKEILIILDKTGKFIDQIESGHHYEDLSFSDYKNFEIKDSLIICETTYEEYNTSSLKVEHQKISYSHFIISEKGILQKIGPFYPQKNRKYPFTSVRLISQTELDSIPEHDLDLMRNEIYADHGYIFKSSEWKLYFESKEWYKPLASNVESKLNPIEKINIRLILKKKE